MLLSLQSGYVETQPHDFALARQDLIGRNGFPISPGGVQQRCVLVVQLVLMVLKTAYLDVDRLANIHSVPGKIAFLFNHNEVPAGLLEVEVLGQAAEIFSIESSALAETIVPQLPVSTLQEGIEQLLLPILLDEGLVWLPDVSVGIFSLTLEVRGEIEEVILNLLWAVLLYLGYGMLARCLGVNVSRLDRGSD